MYDLDIEFDDMGLVDDQGYQIGSFTGVAHCEAVARDHAVVVDITVERSKITQDRRGYDRISKMLDRKKPAERVLFHQLSDAFKAAYREVIAERLAEGYADYRAHLGVDAWIDNYRGK